MLTTTYLEARRLLKLVRDSRAVTAMEYGLIASLIAVVVIVSVTSIGKNLSTTFTKVAAQLGT